MGNARRTHGGHGVSVCSPEHPFVHNSLLDAFRFDPVCTGVLVEGLWGACISKTAIFLF